MVADEEDLLVLIRQHLTWYPLSQVQDVYKLIYQGAMGPEHLVDNPQEFARRFEVEWASLLPARQERLLEAVRKDGTLYRLNLRPYKADDKPVEWLVPLFLQTCGLIQGSKEALIKTWSNFVGLAEQGLTEDFMVHEVRRFSKWLEREDYPPVHHSQVYRREYQPAYRLIAEQYIAGLV